MKRKKFTALLTMFSIMTASVSAVCSVQAEEADVSYYERAEEEMISLDGYSDNIIYDLKYCGENSTDYQKLHLVLPDNAAEGEKLPLLVFVHGGVWSSMNSEDHKVGFTAKAALQGLNYGYAVALVDYSIRNADNSTALPNQIYEIKAAVRYLRSIADEYNLDADKIALIGESAGGHLVDIVGTTNGEEQYDVEEYGNMDYSSDVQAVIAQYSVGKLEDSIIKMLFNLYDVDEDSYTDEDIEKMREQASAIYHVDENDPPFYLEHGLEDNTVSYTQSCDLYNALMMAGDSENTELHLYAGMDHAVSWFQSEENAKGYMEWLNKIFER